MGTMQILSWKYMDRIVVGLLDQNQKGYYIQRSEKRKRGAIVSTKKLQISKETNPKNFY